MQLEALRGFQLLRAHLILQGANELLKNMYNIVRQQNSQVIEERLLHLEEASITRLSKGTSLIRLYPKGLKLSVQSRP